MNKAIKALFASSLLAVGLVGCGDDSDDMAEMASPMTAQYEVAFINLAYNQPMSPVFAALHDDSYRVWNEGSAASVSLETMAESGDNSMLLTEAMASDAVWASGAGTGIVGPSGMDTLSLTLTNAEVLPYLTLTSMLVNTNDAFVGVNHYPLGAMAVGDSVVIPGHVWDAGSEANTEAAGSIPGPADGGEGFNAERETMDRVRIHAGVVTMADGLSSSVLDESHRFLGPVAHIVVTRMN